MEEQQFTSGHDFHARLLNYDEQLKKLKIKKILVRQTASETEKQNLKYMWCNLW